MSDGPIRSRPQISGMVGRGADLVVTTPPQGPHHSVGRKRLSVAPPLDLADLATRPHLRPQWTWLGGGGGIVPYRCRDCRAARGVGRHLSPAHSAVAREAGAPGSSAVRRLPWGGDVAGERSEVVLPVLLPGEIKAHIPN